MKDYLEESHGLEHYKSILLEARRTLIEKRGRLPL